MFKLIINSTYCSVFTELIQRNTNKNLIKRLSILHTFCGAWSSLWTPAIWLISGISSLNVYRGGLVGSGKLVLLNGSVSSKNCTLHINVAIMYPCKAIFRSRKSGCDTTASDRQTGRQPPAPPTPENRSSAVAKSLQPPLSLDSLHSFNAKSSGQCVHHSRSKDPGCLVAQGGAEVSGAAVSKGIADVRGAEGNCGRDCNTWRPVCESDAKRLLPQAQTVRDAAASDAMRCAAPGRQGSCYARNGDIQWRVRKLQRRPSHRTRRNQC